MLNPKVKFALGTLLTPMFLLEDGLRKAGMNIHPKGMLHNNEGKSIMEIWKEAGEEVRVEAAIRAEIPAHLPHLHDALLELKRMGITLK